MQMVDSNAVIPAFATARDEYLATMRRVPEGAVQYLKPGDDYSLGGIAVHVNYVLEHYANVLEAMVGAGFGECRPEDPEGLHDAANARAKASLTSEQVASELARSEDLHRRVVGILEGIAGDLDRKAPVWYPDATETYPTSAVDVMGWLTDHYREHVPQIEALAAEAEGATGGPTATVAAFCEAFDRGDVDAVMALMTDDCIFESTLPPPDGERLTGQAAVRAYWERFFASTEAPRFDNEEMFEAGDRVVSRWRFSWGSGEGAGHVRGVDLYRVRGGKVAEKLAYVKG